MGEASVQVGLSALGIDFDSDGDRLTAGIEPAVATYQGRRQGFSLQVRGLMAGRVSWKVGRPGRELPPG